MAYKSYFEEEKKEIKENKTQPYQSVFAEDAPTMTISATTGAGIPQNLQPEIPATAGRTYGYEKPGDEETETSKRYKNLLDKNSTPAN